MNLTLTLLIGIACVVFIPHLILNYVLWLPVYLQIMIHVPLAVLYWFWTPTEWTDFRMWPGWSLIRDDYLGITYHGPGKDLIHANPNEQPPYCFALHPHGVHATSLMFGFALQPSLCHVRVFGTSLLFRIPLVKELVGWGGTLRADREKVLFELKSGHSIALAPGGLAELPGLVPEWTDDPRSHDAPYPPDSDYYRNWRIRGVVHGRGFLRYARAASTSDVPVCVIPVWAKGENELYRIWLPLPKIQRWLLQTWLRYPWFIIARGHRWFWFWPKKLAQGIQLWIGQPLDVSKADTLQEAEKQFYDALDALREQSTQVTQVGSGEEEEEEE